MKIDSFNVGLNLLLTKTDYSEDYLEGLKKDLFISLQSFKNEFGTRPNIGVSLVAENHELEIEKILFDDSRKFVELTLKEKSN